LKTRKVRPTGKFVLLLKGELSDRENGFLTVREGLEAHPKTLRRRSV
jgi:hypothetical protein